LLKVIFGYGGNGGNRRLLTKEWMGEGFGVFSLLLLLKAW